MDYNIEDDFKKGLREQLVGIGIKSGDVSQDKVKQIVNNFYRTYIIKNLPKINHAMMQKGRSMNDEEWEKVANNPSGVKNDTDGKVKKDDKHSESIEKTLKALGNVRM